MAICHHGGGNWIELFCPTLKVRREPPKTSGNNMPEISRRRTAAARCLWRLVRLRNFVRYNHARRTSGLRCMEAAERPECSGARGLTITNDNIRKPDGAGECRTRQLISMASPRRFRIQRFLYFLGFRFHLHLSHSVAFIFQLSRCYISSSHP